ncbi:unnamed protein product [Vitrella brassicaformis CCMP3155]|uniref:Uncharacterized protein n=1 Tax=Vitrella brassicaformis (strain CCMP3155) TaxID=1169540 RepID=A0A0G4GMP1_VITBC|nr:unnamed protein product [Vitrella brassicaformis CCMP3155]|eukprot:CEM31467.1 unnamed protein product [Vitrella brassicaformis CCMP3155]
MSQQASLKGVNRLLPDLTQYFLQWYGDPAELWFHHAGGDNIFIGTVEQHVAHDFDVAEQELARVLQHLEEGLLVLGCPFGTSEFMEWHFAKVLKKTQHMLDNLPQLEDPQSAYQLLRLYAMPKFHYHIRPPPSSPPRSLRPPASTPVYSSKPSAPPLPSVTSRLRPSARSSCR